MGYATAMEYAMFCPSTPLDAPELTVLLERASDEVDALCFGRIRQRGFAKLTQYQQDKVRKAVCLHVAFLAQYGDAVDSPLASYGINGVSMAFDGSRVVQNGGVTTCGQVYNQLLQSGLAYRGVR